MQNVDERICIITLICILQFFHFFYRLIYLKIFELIR